MRDSDILQFYFVLQSLSPDLGTLNKHAEITMTSQHGTFVAHFNTQVQPTRSTGSIKTHSGVIYNKTWLLVSKDSLKEPIKKHLCMEPNISHIPHTFGSIWNQTEYIMTEIFYK